MNIPFGKYRIRLLILSVAIILLVIAACAQQSKAGTTPQSVTAQLPTLVAAFSLATTASAVARLPTELATTPATPIIQVIKETVVVTPTPLPNAGTASLATTVTSCNRGKLNLQEEVVIGALYPFSNSAMMQHGFTMQAATNIAVDDINAQGGIDGKPLRVVAYDSGSIPAQGALFAERLITMDCVAAIIGIFHSDVAIAVKEVAVQYHIPVIFADPYAEEITADLPAEIFRIAPLRTMFTEMMGKWLAAVGDYNQDQDLYAVLLTENTRYGQLRLERAKEILPTYGIEIECFAIDLPTSDFSPVIARIVALDRLPDVIFVNINDAAVLSLNQQLIAAGIGPERNTLLVSTDSILDNTRFWQQVPEGNYGIGLQIGPWPSTVSSFGQAFAKKIALLFDGWPEAIAFEAYDATWLIANAIDRADSLNPDDIIDALERTDITLASGHYTFPYGSLNLPDGITVPTYMWHQWLDPQLLYLQYTTPNQSSAEAAVIWPPTYQTTDAALVPELANRPALLGQRH